MMKQTIGKKVLDLLKVNVPAEDRQFVNTQIAALAEELAARPVNNLDVVQGKYPGWGNESPARCARGEQQRTVARELLWSLFTNGKRGDYIVYVDFPQ